LAKPQNSGMFSNQTNKTINLADPPHLALPSRTQALALTQTPLEKVWAKSLYLMGGEFYHFAHFDEEPTANHEQSKKNVQQTNSE